MCGMRRLPSFALPFAFAGLDIAPGVHYVGPRNQGDFGRVIHAEPSYTARADMGRRLLRSGTSIHVRAGIRPQAPADVHSSAPGGRLPVAALGSALGRQAARLLRAQIAALAHLPAPQASGDASGFAGASAGAFGDPPRGRLPPRHDDRGDGRRGEEQAKSARSRTGSRCPAFAESVEHVYATDSGNPAPQGPQLSPVLAQPAGVLGVDPARRSVVSKKNRQDKFLTGEEFKIWRISRNLSQKEAGEWLGITQPSVLKRESGGCTREQALAMAALDHGLKPWQPTDEDRAAAAKGVVYRER